MPLQPVVMLPGGYKRGILAQQLGGYRLSTTLLLGYRVLHRLCNKYWLRGRKIEENGLFVKVKFLVLRILERVFFPCGACGLSWEPLVGTAASTALTALCSGGTGPGNWKKALLAGKGNLSKAL